MVVALKEDIAELQWETRHLRKQKKSLVEQHELEIAKMNKKLKIVEGHVVIQSSGVNVIITSDLQNIRTSKS
jgi:hypothetical protein